MNFIYAEFVISYIISFFLRLYITASVHDDPALNYMKQLNTAIKNAECNLVNGITYNNYIPQDGEMFDFIIVGGGSAGSVLANRLSENSSWSVLLLEAGGDPTITSEVPRLFNSLQGSELDWKFYTEPSNASCLATVNHSCSWPRGKVLGGSSTINAMFYLRGHPSDYNSWAEMGNSKWSYEGVLPFFKKSEDFRVEELYNDPEFTKYHNTGGYLKVEDFFSNKHFKDLSQHISGAFKEFSLNTYADINSNHDTGFFRIQGTLYEAKRCSAAKAFLNTARSRKNLKLSKYSLVSKLLIHKNNKTVYGVELLNQNHSIKIKSRCEVIVSAGSINSPQLLMLSGIGPKEHLEEIGIEVTKDSKVGQNLQDHVIIRGVLFSTNLTMPAINPIDDMYEFLLHSSGQFGNSVFNYFGFIKTDPLLQPAIQLYFSTLNINESSLQNTLDMFGYNREIQQFFIDLNMNTALLFMFPCLLHPKSRGQILLKTNSILDHPLIDSGYFTNKEDIETLLKSIRFITKLGSSNSLKKISCKIIENILPGCEPYEFNSDEYWECVIRHLGTTIYHPVGTCKMGPSSDPMAVVNQQLKVIGINNLRVCDASIMPMIVGGNINAATIMIGEKCAEMVRSEWN